MVSTELYVAGLKRKEMVVITHGSSVEGSRGTRYRLYGTYTDPETKKIHKANSFVSKAKYDEITAKMGAGMPVADVTIEKVEVFAEESPVDAEPSDLGGPSEPDDAGVPADVGGDEPVPMGDEPSDIQEFEAEYHQYVYVGDDELAKVKGYKWCIENDRDVQNWIIPEDEPQFFTNQFGQIVEADRYEVESFEAEANVGTTIDDIIMDEYVDEGEALEDAEEYARKARQALNELGAEENGPCCQCGTVLGKMTLLSIPFTGENESWVCDDASCYEHPDIVSRLAESVPIGVVVEDGDPSSPPEGIFATEQEREVEEAARKKEYGYTHSSTDDYRPELDDSSFVDEIDESALYEYELEQERLRENPVETQEEVVLDVAITPEIEETVVETTTGPEPGTWAGVALDMAMMSSPDDNFDWNAWKDEMKEGRGAESYESYRKRAEMTLREWGESELDEEKHDFSQNPNESFREWLDEEVRAHGDISFREWADEEEGEETKAAETVTKSAETDQDMETVDTQTAVALGIPPEIWRDTSRDKQDAYIASMMLDVTTVRDLAEDGEFELIMAMANEQKETVTSGDLSLIECNVCGITASQLLDDLGGVCEITDPNGGANPNWVRGVSCPFEKYYSLTRAVYDEVEDELRDSQTVVQIHTPRPATAMAAESVSKRASRYARVGRTFNGRGYRKYRTESLMESEDIGSGDFYPLMEFDFTNPLLYEGTGWRYTGVDKERNKMKRLQDEIRSNGGWYLLDGDWEGDYEEALIADKDGNTMEIRWYFDTSQFRDNKVGDNPKWDGGLDYNFNFDYFNPKGMVEWRDTDGKLLAQAPFTKMEKIPLDKKVKKIAETLGADALMNITKDTSLDSFTPTELTESSAIQGDFDHASLNFSGRQNIQARAETFNSDSWDDLYVVAENQMGGWEACDVTDGVLQTYANQADAEREAQMTIDDLNSMGGDYSPTSWAGKRLSEVDVADNVEFIRYPNGLEAPYDELHRGRSMNDPVTQLNATRGIDTFTEPFEDDEESSNWLLAAGIAGVFALGAWLLPKGD